ncbi:glycosyltransferase family 2 protein [Ruegeria atlantica]|uniref:glycosyltransferase family 2 protein n=1 Tax=Ruegeria atlantica TaxID=81569 RepID=UPI00147AD909|nr:glycosyltransferase family 2 protein [Ruegeria atlantica]
MKVAAVTMVYKDHWYLEKWVQYYGQLFGAENLYIIGHGDDPVHCELAKDCNHIRVPRNQLPEDFDEQRWRMLSDICAVLIKSYDWVFCGDVDEIILPTRTEETLLEVLKRQTPESVIGAVGFEIMPRATSQWLLQFSPRYSKPSVLGRPIKFSLGAHGAFGDWKHDPDFALIHFPLANRDSFRQRAQALESDLEELKKTPSEERTYRQNALISWGHVQRRKAEGAAPEGLESDIVPLKDAAQQAAPLLAKTMKVMNGTEYRVAPRKLRHVQICAQIDDRLTELFS